MILRDEDNSRQCPITRLLAIPCRHEAKLLLGGGSCQVALVRQCIQGRLISHKSPIIYVGGSVVKGIPRQRSGGGGFEDHDA